jgi:hypothetical protein
MAVNLFLKPLLKFAKFTFDELFLQVQDLLESLPVELQLEQISQDICRETTHQLH